MNFFLHLNGARYSTAKELMSKLKLQDNGWKKSTKSEQYNTNTLPMNVHLGFERAGLTGEVSD